MRYGEILLEYKRDKTEERFGAELRTRFMTELANSRQYHDGADQYLEHLSNLVPGFQFTKGLKMQDAVLNFLELVDPTAKKAYVAAMARWYSTGSMQRLEDAAKAKSVIIAVQKFANRLKGVNVMQLSFDDFLDLGDSLVGKKSRAETAKEEEENLYTTGQATKFYDGPDMKIVKPHTVVAAQYFGRGTRWCTASQEDNMFEYYAKLGEIYCILFKGEDSRWQFHFETEQFMDEKDHDLPQDTDLFKSVMTHFQHELENRLWPHVKNRIGAQALKFLTDPPHELIIDLVSEDGDNIQYVKPSDRDDQVWFAALTNTWEALSHALSPSENIILFAIKQNPNAIKYVPAPTVNEQVAAVQQDPDLVYTMFERYGTHICPEAAKIAISHNPRLIRYCGDQPLEIQVAAFKGDRATLQDIQNPKPELIKYAVQQNGRNLIYIPRSLWTEEYKMIAVKSNPTAILFISNPSEELVKAAEAAPKETRDILRHYS